MYCLPVHRNSVLPIPKFNVLKCFVDLQCIQQSYFDLEFNTSQRCFYLSEETLSFYKARESCAQHNMTLASVDSQVSNTNPML